MVMLDLSFGLKTEGLALLPEALPPNGISISSKQITLGWASVA